MRCVVLISLFAIGCGGDAEIAMPDATSVATIVCTGAAPGAYCGGDQVDGGDPSSLYQCPGAGMAPTSVTACAAGCIVEAAGVPDRCMMPVSTESFRLPWRPGQTMYLTQDCDDSCCADHVGNDEYAYDWGAGGAFTVIAARGGTVTHLKINSTTGCGSSSCANDANVLVIDHGDGTQSTYLHLAGHTLAAGIACGATIARGQELATSGTTGWSTGNHLHFQVSKVHANATSCECGADGLGCNANTVPWTGFWVSSTYPSVPVQFDEWPEAAQCNDRRIAMPASQNE